MKKLLFLDTETTGIEEEDRICQIAFREPDFEPTSGLIKPPLPVKLIAMSVNNITNDMVNDPSVPEFEISKYRAMLEKMEQSHIMVAHNVQYDAGMLKKEGVEFDQTICTLKLVHYLDKECKLEKHNLSYLRYYFKLDVNANAHDALDDIIILEAVFGKIFWMMKELLGNVSEEDIINKMIEISSKPTLYRRMPFGKYKGERLTDIASDNVFDKKGRSWMQWLLREKMTNPEANDADWIYTLDYYLNADSPVGK